MPNFGLKQLFAHWRARPALAPGLVLICLLMTWCGIWSLLGAVLVAAQHSWSGDSIPITIALFLFAALCLAIVYGLFKFQNWARIAIMVLSVIMMIVNAGTWYVIQEDLFGLRGLYLVLPCGFAALVLWYFSKRSIAALYSDQA